MKRLNWQVFGNLALLLQSFGVLFHLLVVVGIVPFSIVWGGRLANHSQMLVFETVSITANLLIMWLVSMKVGYTKQRLSNPVLKILFWIFTGLFALNTIGNLLSTSILETVIFTPVTFLLSISFFKLARA